MTGEPVLAEHLLVAGPSGGGKSTLLRELHDRHAGLSVFLTPESDRSASNHGRRRVIDEADYRTAIEPVRRWARSSPESVQIIVDEAQEAPSFLDSEGADGPIRSGLHRDRKKSIKWVIATQNPQDLHTSKRNYSPLQQCEYWVFVGKAKTWHGPFLDGNNMGDLKPYVPDQPFEYIVIDPALKKTGRERIAFRGRTKARYG